jgi:hypothetical protein
LAKPPAGSPEPPSLREVQHFLQLLDDVTEIQKLLMEETVVLRARVQELEARSAEGPERERGEA